MGQHPLSSLSEVLTEPIDLFICSASYEERCKSIADNLPPKLAGKVLVCHNQDLAKFVGANREYLMRLFGSRASLVSLSTDDPLLTVDALASAIEESAEGGTRKLLVDMTTFTREGLLILLGLLNYRRSNLITYLAYTGAADYSMGQQGEDKWLSKGVSDIRSVLGFSGNLMPSEKTHLIVLAGYEQDRAAEVIKAYEASVVSIGFGAKERSIAAQHFEVNYAFSQRLASMYGNINQFCFSLVDPSDAQGDIKEQIALYPDHNVVIAPLNNKVSTVGAAYAAFSNPEIQICYAQASRYNYENYSKPGDSFYLYEMPHFGNQ